MARLGRSFPIQPWITHGTYVAVADTTHVIPTATVTTSSPAPLTGISTDVPVGTGDAVSTAPEFTITYVLAAALADVTAPAPDHSSDASTTHSISAALVNADALAPTHVLSEITHEIPAATVMAAAVAPLEAAPPVETGVGFPGLRSEPPRLIRHYVPTATVYASAVAPTHSVIELDPVLASVGIDAVQLDEEALVAFTLLTPF